MRYGYSILMFCFATMLLLYSGLLAWTKDANLLPRRTQIKKSNKLYIVKLAKIIALVSVAPALSAFVGLFTQNIFLILASLILGFIVCIRIGILKFF